MITISNPLHTTDIKCFCCNEDKDTSKIISFSENCDDEEKYPRNFYVMTLCEDCRKELFEKLKEEFEEN